MADMKVIIVGIGDIGRQLAEELSARGGFTLVLIDRDPDKCEVLSQELDALVLNGDGTEPELLKDAGSSEADALIATTESDAMNMVIAILGKRLSIDTVIVKLNTLNLRGACREVVIDHVIMPKITASMEIASILHGYNVLNLSYLVKTGARLMEVTSEGIAGRLVQDFDLPQGSLLIAVIRDNVATVPHGKTKLRDGDTLLILADSPSKLEQVESVLEKLKDQSETGR